MYYPAILILTNYIPLQLEEGMMFKTVMFPNTDKEFTELFTFPFHKGVDREDVFTQYGYPVELMILDYDGETLAMPDQIGWWDEGEHTEDLRDIVLKDINTILKDEGKIEIDISSDAYQINQVVVTMAEGKVILRIPIDEYEPEFDDLPDNEIEEEDY